MDKKGGEILIKNRPDYVDGAVVDFDAVTVSIVQIAGGRNEKLLLGIERVVV